MTASYGGVALDNGTVNVTVQGAAVTVLPDGGTLVRPPVTASSQTFIVNQTVGVVPATYNLAAVCAAPAATGCPSLSPITVTTLNTPQNVVVNFTSGVAGAATGRVTLTATHSTQPTVKDTGYVDVRVVNATSVPVTPTTTVTPNATGLSLSFTVTNTGPVAATFDLTGVCGGTGLSACQASPVQLANLAVNTPTNVTVTYDTGASGSGTVALQVRNQTVLVATGTSNVTIASQQAPVVSLSRWNPGATVPRQECVTIALGPAAAAECGGLRIVHALPALRTMNKDRAPTLLYESEQAEPTPQVAAMVTLATTASRPDTVRAVLRLGGLEHGRGRWLGSQWTLGVPRLIRVRDTVATTQPTGVVTYTIDVTSVYNSPHNELTATTSQVVAVVNRQASFLGRGWWLAGLEQLNTSTFVWVGGDGSVRQYSAAGTDKWVAPSIDYPDTLKKTNPSPVEYTRFLRGGLKVVFNALGQHVRTVNRVGHTTSFWYNGVGALDSIVLPVRVPGAGNGRRFVFTYPANQVKVDDGQGRVTTVNLSGGSVNRVTSIAGPDAFSVSFGYPAAASGLVTSRTDRVNSVRLFALDSLRHVTRAALFPGAPYLATDSIIVSLQAAESQGAPFGTSVDTVNATTVFNGPRVPTNVTTFWTNQYGAPWKILNAATATTLLQRTSAFAGFVTQLTTVSGQVLVATPDARGRVRTVIDQSVTTLPTTYTWEDGFDQLTRIDPPEADFTVFVVETGTGNQLGQYDARGATAQITFAYSTGQLTTVTYPGTAAQRFTYDNQGNLDSANTALGYTSKRVNDGVGRAQTITSQIKISPLQYLTETHTYTLWNQDLISTSAANGESVTITTSYDAEGRPLSTSRAFSPDPKVIGTLTDGWTYDLAGRTLSQSRAGGGTDTHRRDQAGNLTTVTTARGYPIQMGYDPLNRMTSRSIPQAPGAPHTTTFTTTFPANVPYSDTVLADNETFQYSNDGVLSHATNCDADVVRTIHPSGRIDAETRQIRTVTGACNTYGSHVYTTSYGYDRDNRRIRVSVPAILRRRRATVFGRSLIRRRVAVESPVYGM